MQEDDDNADGCCGASKGQPQQTRPGASPIARDNGDWEFPEGEQDGKPSVSSAQQKLDDDDSSSEGGDGDDWDEAAGPMGRRNNRR